MSRLIPCHDMSRDQVMQCCYDARAIVALCEIVAREGSGELGGALSTDIAIALKLAGELIAVLHAVVEIHEGAAASTAHAERAAVSVVQT